MLTFVPYIIAVIASIIILGQKSGKDLHVPFFFAPWGALELQIGTSVPMFQILTITLFLKYFVMGNIRKDNLAALSLVFLYLLLTTIIGVVTIEYGPKVPLFAEGNPLRNGYGRIFTTFITLLLSFLYVLLVIRLRDKIAAISLIKTYLASCVTLGLFGLLQLFVFTATGTDIFPIGLFHDARDSIASVSIQGVKFLRISSFAGEPKGFGQFVAIGLGLIFAFNNYLGWNQLRRFLTSAFLLCILLATFSTSGMVVLFCLCFFIPIMRYLKRPFLASEVKKIMIAISGLSIGLFYWMAASFNLLAPPNYKEAATLWELIRSRTVGRLRLDDADAIIMESMIKNYDGIFFGRGLGLVHHYTLDFIPRHAKYYLDGQIIPPKSGVTLFFGYGGLLGLLLMTLLAASLIPNLSNRHKYIRRNHVDLISKLQALCFGLWAAHLMRIYAMDATWAIFSIVSVIGYQISKISRAHEN